MTSGIYKTQAQKAEERTKILQVINAIGKVTDVHEMLKHPIIKGSNFTTRSLGQHLKYLNGQGEVRQKAGHKWAPIQSRELPAVHRPKRENGNGTGNRHPTALEGIFFVLSPDTQTLMLEVGGLRLPVHIER